MGFVKGGLSKKIRSEVGAAEFDLAADDAKFKGRRVRQSLGVAAKSRGAADGFAAVQIGVRDRQGIARADECADADKDRALRAVGLAVEDLDRKRAIFMQPKSRFSVVADAVLGDVVGVKGSDRHIILTARQQHRSRDRGRHKNRDKP